MPMAMVRARSGCWKLLTLLLPAALLTTAALAQPAFADEAAAASAGAHAAGDMLQKISSITVSLDTAWTLLAAFLVFFMNLGFAMVESGLCRSKNAVNILAKNFIVFAVSSIGFYVLGWGLMFGSGSSSWLSNTGWWMVSGADNSPAVGAAYQGDYAAINWTGIPLWAKFFFQLVFCGTAATIVSGAVAERIKFGVFILFSFILTGLVYPLIGHLIWGGGYLALKGMFDFAGSSVVHSVGGWAALAGVLVLGPRIGKYGPDGKINAIPGHSMTGVTLGGLVLWFGWFGFNPGSTMGAVGYADAIGHIAVTTNTAAAAATLSATVMAWWLLGKPDLSMIINGTLAGLVAITAPCAFVSVFSSLIIGLAAGVIVVLAVLVFDRLRLDDPVGALSVHLVNGVFGTLCVGLFADTSVSSVAQGAGALGLRNGLFFGGGIGQLWSQFLGVAVVGVAAFTLSLAAWMVLKATLGIRVSAEEELSGLDLGAHGQHAYPDVGMVVSLDGVGGGAPVVMAPAATSRESRGVLAMSTVGGR